MRYGGARSIQRSAGSVLVMRELRRFRFSRQGWRRRALPARSSVLGVCACAQRRAVPDRVASVLLFLAALRAVQDYVIYPRLIKRTLHLHPLGVVVAIWVGAALGGVVGVCLAIPLVGVLKAALRHWREYREIEQLIARNGERAPAAATSAQ